MEVQFQKYNSPVGPLYLVANDQKLVAIVFGKNWQDWRSQYEKAFATESAVLKRTALQLDEYFAGKRKSFDIPYELHGTDFQKRVWTALAKIPFGKTKTYKEQAVMVKSPKAVRAVGGSNGRNPLCIILPCHRVIGSNGTLTGYGGGMEAKQFLLKHEGIEAFR